ncbi:ABC transporter ATP-binding protein [Brevibacillus sp. H7]|uniref:ABC transporter ATP-binding protein n=1 Tax=Brevibacillus sp. H7 TaxID=3349138 RepID=UPI0037F18363
MTLRLEMRNMTKTYGDFTANDNISFDLKEGEVHAIVGENGAGKTTLMRMLYGMEQPSAGEIYLNGQRVELAGPHDAIRHGIGMVHQHFMLFPDFTVAENIVIGYEPRKAGLFQREKAKEEVLKLAERYGISIDPTARLSGCAVGEQQRVEILKVLYQGADIIVLDEPTAVLTPLEVKGLLATIRNLAQGGKSIILITHKLQEVMEVADRITVLRNGKVTGTVNRQETTAEELARLMVGRDLQPAGERVNLDGKPLLEVHHLTVQVKGNKPLVDQVSFTVHHGEIVGIAGVSGNGQSELLQVITGLRQADGGSVTLAGRDVTNRSVAEIRQAGLAHIPEDRYLWGAAKQESVAENALMGYYQKPAYSRGFIIARDVFRKLAEEWVKRFAIKTGSLEEKAGNLSGGNLQKLIVARELGQETPLLIAAEPTRGVDIGAMETIHQALLDKRNKGDGILLVSSELTEILALSDRILVMYEGRIAGELKRAEATEEKISVLMAGGSLHGTTQATV